MQFTEQQISIVARSLSDSAALACGVNKDDTWKIYSEQYIEEATSALEKLSAAAPQVVVDERAAFEVHITDNGTWPRAAERSVDGEYRLMATAVAWNTWRVATDSFASRTAAPVQAQEPVLVQAFEESGSDRESGAWFDIAASEAKSYADEGYKVRKLFAAPVQPVAVPDGGRNAALDEAAELVLSCHQKANRRGIATAIRMLKAAPTATPAAQGDAKDAERWRFMMAIAENEEGPEAKAIELLGNDLMDKDESNAKQMIELVDAAIAAIAAKAAS